LPVYRESHIPTFFLISIVINYDRVFNLRAELIYLRMKRHISFAKIEENHVFHVVKE
jgi:hypothetical protein